MRLGWFTCSPLFAERLERIGETSTQSPCGLGQSLAVALLSQWTFDGYVRWLRGLRTQYRLRRDLFIDCLADEFDLFPTPASAVPRAWAAIAGDPALTTTTTTVLTAYARRGGAAHEKKTHRPLLSFVPPAAGMFVWVELYFGDVPDETDEEDGSVITPERQFWLRLIDAGVLTVPGWYFFPETHAAGGAGGGGGGEGGVLAAPPAGTSADGRIGHMRLSYTPSDVSAQLFFFFFWLLTEVARIAWGGVDGDDAPGREDFRADAPGILPCLGLVWGVGGCELL